MGGAIVDRRQVKVEKFKTELNKKLKGKELTEIEFSENSSWISEVKLEASGEKLSLGLQIEPVTKEPAITANISSLYEEITKEEKVEVIKQRIDSKIEELANKHLGEIESQGKTPLELLNKTKTQIKNQQLSRTRRSASNEALTAEQRKNLQKFFSLYNALIQEKSNFSSELQKISDAIQTLEARTEAQTSQPNSKKVMLSLMKLGWDGSNLRSNLSQQVENLEHFYGSKEEVNKALSSLSQNQNALSAQIQAMKKLARDFGNARRGLQNHFSRQLQTLKKEYSNVSGDIQFVIGAKLLEWMGQLKDN